LTYVMGEHNTSLSLVIDTCIYIVYLFHSHHRCDYNKSKGRMVPS
jgi:hypothetical protein